MILTASSCSADPGLTIATWLGIGTVAAGALIRSRMVARFVVENLIGPWRGNVVAQARWRESIDAWVVNVRVLVLIFGAGALVIVFFGIAATASCG